MRTLIWSLLATFTATFFGMFAALAARIWTGDARWGWSALLLLVACVVSGFCAVGFMGVEDGRKRRQS